jgi:DeoR/GlpR family transcriptional regulator of sugar metabolism
VLSTKEGRLELSDRQQQILELLERDGQVSVADLAQHLQVSDVTIRKDLQELEELSFLKRVHGGAVPAHRSKYNLALGDKISRLATTKTGIAQAALGFIHDGDTLILDAGSTVLALARLLPGRFRGLTIVTNSLPVIGELCGHSDFDLVSLGGMVRLHSLAMIGPLTVHSLRKLHADRVFVGATGATIERGLSTPNFIEAETKAAMIEAAHECIALLDGTKVGAASLAPFASWNQVHHLVTDAPLPTPVQTCLTDANVQVTLANRS